MEDKTDRLVTEEVESRLDDLFEDTAGSMEFIENGGAVENTPLRDLKAIVLSIDWEIDDEILSSFIEETGKLRAEYKGQKIVILFLQLLDSVGKHIKNNKEKAHPDAIKILISVYNSLEKVVLDEKMTEAEKKKVLFLEVNKFKKLKAEIASKRSPVPTVVPVARDTVITEAPAVPPASPSRGTQTPHEAFLFALEEIKKVIQAEFQALRAEIKLWREES